ncbi:hypothetical protein BDQ17DRAFT_1351415 [Cyathus striatus]|nr:hypothetical protein BDQ17DRAFT_1351415 [Cyathus striatus]
MLASILRTQPRRVLSVCRSSNVLLSSKRTISCIAARPTLSTTSILASTSFSRSFSNNRESAPNTTLYVSNLPFSSTEDDLVHAFSKFGPVKSSVILRDGERSRGSGFVHFENIEDAIAARQANDLNRLELDDRQLNIAYGLNKFEDRRPGRNDRNNRRERKERPEPKTPTDTLFLGRLDFKATEGDLELLFSEFGSIKEIKIARDESGESLGYGWLVFENADNALAARRSSEAEPFFLFGQDIVVRLNESKTRKRASESNNKPSERVFVAKLSPAADEEDVERLFSSYGTVKSVEIGRRPDGASRGFGFVTFENVEDATRAVEKSKADPDAFYHIDRNVVVEFGESAKRLTTKEPSETLFIGQLPYSADEADVSAVFSEFGELRDVHILRERDGSSRGIAFVAFENVDDAVVAHTANKEKTIHINDRPVVVDYTGKGRAESNTIEIRDIAQLKEHKWSKLFEGFDLIQKAAASPRGGSNEYVFYATFDSVATAQKAMEQALKRKEPGMRLKFGKTTAVRDD